MTADEILDGILEREGGYRPEIERPDGSVDPETVRGITWPTYQSYCRHLQRVATHEAFLALTAEDAKTIYRLLFIENPGFTAENIPYEPLRVQLIDFGVNSGPARAIRWLQRVLRLPATGSLDIPTRLALQEFDTFGPESRVFVDRYYGLINDALVAARSYMIDQAVDHGTIRAADEEGLESRALSFFLAQG